MRNFFKVLVLVLAFAGCGELTSPRGSDSGFTSDNPCAAPDVPAECATNAECVDDDPCTQDACNTKIGRCDHKSDPDCKLCKPGADDPTCDDHNPCTDDECILVVLTDNVGKCENVVIAGCINECTTDEDCEDGDLCTIDSCVDGQWCQHELQQCGPGAHCLDDTCVPDDPCDDGNACTVDAKAMDGSCLHADIDFGPGYYCDSSKGKPFARPVPAECVDDNVCTDDHYNNSTGLCWWDMVECMDPINYHCETDEKGEPICVVDCDDGNQCTMDYYKNQDGCVHDVTKFCAPCKTDADCAGAGWCDETNLEIVVTTVGECKPDGQCAKGSGQCAAGKYCQVYKNDKGPYLLGASCI